MGIQDLRPETPNLHDPYKYTYIRIYTTTVLHDIWIVNTALDET